MSARDVTTVRVRAPEFPAGTWINTAEPLSLARLRGSLVLLDFWTFACGNCLHVLDELRELERDYPDVLVIVGVHSPKFEHEKSDAVVSMAAERYGVGHPVFNDPDMYLWRQYAVRAWPTLVLIDPDGYVIAQAAGEGQVTALRSVVDDVVAARGADLVGRDNPYRPPVPEPGEFRFPSRAVLLPGGGSGAEHGGDLLAVVDTGHEQVALTAPDGRTVVRRIGSGRRGRTGQDLDGPNSVAVVPAALAAGFGYDLLIADTGSHTLRGARSSDGVLVATVDLAAGLAGTSTVTGPVPGVLSPWDVVHWPAAGLFVIAAAGVHLLLGWNPVDGAVTILAGTTVEGLKDGPAADAWLAQPSGLAVDGDRVWFADSETSALRYLTLAGTVHTAVGEGLFDFGHVDGPAATARFQHPLGVAVLPDGSIAVADTYNGAVRRYDPVTDTVATLARDLSEPSGVVVVDGDLIVVESGAHQLLRAVPGAGLEQVVGESMRTDRPSIDLAAGPVSLTVPFTPAPGRHLDDRFGPSTRLSVSVSPSSLLADGGGDGVDLHRSLVLVGEPGTQGVLHVTAQAASCDDNGAEAAACYLARQDWGVPFRIDPAGAATVDLVLLD